jgi:putative transposase
LLVDTQGLVISANVLTAQIGERDGGKNLLRPLAGKLPRLQVIWADSGYAGNPFEQWVKASLGVRLEIVNHPWTGLRGVWAPEGTTIDWDKILPKGFHTNPLPVVQ